MTEVMYGYAASETQGIIPIAAITKANKPDFGRLSCLGCGREMIASLGQQVRHHFKHKVSPEENACALETYLHRLGKTLLARVLREDLEGGRALIVRTLGNSAHIINLRGETLTTVDETLNTDVLSGAASVDIEKGVRDFIADVLVSFSARPPVLFEVAVSHRCEQDKVNSGLRIVEFLVENEADIERMCQLVRSGWLSASDGVVLHGFPVGEAFSVYAPTFVKDRIRELEATSQETHRRLGQATFDLELSVLQLKKLQHFHDLLEKRLMEYTRQEVLPADPPPALTPGIAFFSSNGAVFLSDIRPEKGVRDRFLFDEPQSNRGIDRYYAAVLEAARLWPDKVRSCFLCAHQGYSTGPKPIFCYEHRTECNQGQASKCEDFKLILGASLDRRRAYVFKRAKTEAQGRAIPR